MKLATCFLLSMMLLTTNAANANEVKTSENVVDNGSLEVFLTNTNYIEDGYTKARGIYVGFSAPVMTWSSRNTSIAIDAAYGNLGTIKGETSLGDDDTVIVKEYVMGLRGNYNISNSVNLYVKAGAANVTLDSSAFGDSSRIEGQVGLGVEMFVLPIGAALNISYMNLSDDMDLLMFGISLR